MHITHNRLLAFCLAASIAGCGGGSQAALPDPGSPATQAAAAGSGAGGTVSTQAVAVGTPLPSGTYWAGTISDYNGGNTFGANCGQSNFAQGFGCIPVTVASGATITGTPVKGQYFQLWGDLSKLPAVTATTISYGPNPYPSSPPTTAPATGPTAAPSGMPNRPPDWTNTVSDYNGGNSFTAGCGQSNFAQGYGCIPVTVTGTSIGTLAKGTHFELWGDLTKLPNVTATYIIYSANGVFPSPAPSGAATANPTSSPTSLPTAPPSGTTYGNLQNAADWATSYTPFASNSIWNTKVSAHPTIASYSAAVVSYQFPGGQNGAPVRANEAGQYDYNHPRFFATAADPLVTLHCTQYCGAPDNGGIPQAIHIPAKARPAGGADAHFDVVQADGTDITAWGAATPSRNWQTGDVLSANNIANCGNMGSGQGWLTGGPGPTAAGYCDQAGIVTAAELASGHIAHALFVTGECAVGSQYPAENGASTQPCTSGVGPPLGGREWYDVPCATTQSNGALRPWEKAILCAFNEYGAYMGDNLGGGAHFTSGVGPEVESEEPWYDFNGQGYISPFAQLASQGWSSFAIAGAKGSASGTRWVGADPWQPSGVDFPNHLHWLAPCSAQGSC